MKYKTQKINRRRKKNKSSKGGSKTITITEKPKIKTNTPLILKLENKQNDDKVVSTIDTNEIIQNIRNIIIDLQHKIFDKVESNYEYFTIMKYQIFIL